MVIKEKEHFLSSLLYIKLIFAKNKGKYGTTQSSHTAWALTN